MAPDTPVWLLDVDGPINCTRPGWRAVPRRSSVRVVDGRELRLCWAPALIDRIRQIHAGGQVEIRWATSWIAPGVLRPVAVRELESLLRLPALPLAWPAPTAELPPGDVLAAKVAAALAVVESGRRLVWTDDDAIPATGPDRAVLDAAGALLIVPSPRRGLLSEHLDTIGGYVLDDRAAAWPQAADGPR
jgi:hypothetical protein